MPKSGRNRPVSSTAFHATPGVNFSLTDQATGTVRDRILDLSLLPGMTLDERYLQERFEFGRTPMREALNRLIVEGLVVARGPRGVQVLPLDIGSAIELFDAYVMSERMVASAVRFADPNLVPDLAGLQDDYIQNLDETSLLRVTELNARFQQQDRRGDPEHLHRGVFGQTA